MSDETLSCDSGKFKTRTTVGLALGCPRHKKHTKSINSQGPELVTAKELPQKATYLYANSQTRNSFLE